MPATISMDQRSSTLITRVEIDQVERMLKLIDLRNRNLSQVSQWLLLWDEVRDISFRFACTTDAVRNDVGEAFKNLLRSMKYSGSTLRDCTRKLEVSEQHFHISTDCDLRSFEACLEFLDDKIAQWFEPKFSADEVSAVWNQVA